MILRLCSARSRRARRLFSILLLLSLLAAVIPLPVSLPASVEKDLSTPFPCQNRPCGCRTAEQCWKSCCCFTNREKIAWAKSHGVTPPSDVYRAAEKEPVQKACCKGCCCSRRHAAQWSTSICQTKSGSCCSAQSTSKQKKQKKQKLSTGTGQKKSATGLVIGTLVQKCQGQGLFWNSLPWAILSESLTEIVWDPLVTRAWCASFKAPDRGDEPPVPPPRVA